MEYCKIPRRVLWQTEARSVSATDGSRIVNRLRRIEGQVRGVAQMIEDDRYCIDVLNQVQAIKAALGRAESEILKRHAARSEEHTSELQSLMRISYAVFCLKKKI